MSICPAAILDTDLAARESWAPVDMSQDAPLSVR